MIHLRNRTEHSFQTAIGRHPAVLACQTPGVPAGITDRHGTWGHVRWAKACKKSGHKPIFGVELAIVPDVELRERQNTAFMTFLARTDAGLCELYKLVTLACDKFYYTPRLDYKLLPEVSDGIIILSGSSPVWGLVPKMQKNFYVELNQLTPVGSIKAALARGYGEDRLVATSDNLYPRQVDRKAYQIILGDKAAMRTRPAHILNSWEWLELWPGHEAALKLAESLAAECTAALPIGTLVHPEVPFTLREMCIKGALERGVNLKDKAYQARMERELELIMEKAFEDYFYVVADMIGYAKQHMFVGPARGSSCGSLVCYLVGITDIDPLPHDLLFERFIDINREDYPDIDIDFQDDKREMVFDYLRKKYGHDNVARLGTVNVFKAKSAISLVAKQLGIPMWETEDVKKSIIERSTGDSRAQFCILDTFEQLEIGRRLLAKYPELKMAAELEGHASHTGKHAAGILVTADSVTNYCAINGYTGTAMLDKYDAESLNLLKIDALGLRTLSVLADCLESVGWPKEKLKQWAITDDKAFEVLRKFKFAGIFQFEGYALQSLAKQMPVESFQDIVSITALARPGPLNSGAATEFLKRRMGKEKVVHLHPLCEPFTRETYGTIIFQETVMQITREIGALSWEDVSQLRKAMSKSLGKEYFDGYWIKFLNGAKEKHKMKEEDARRIWDNVNSMGSWSFNKSHAVAYGLMSYWCCVLKAYYPLEFAAACLRNSKDDDQAVKILRELSKEGYTYKPFDRELSEANWCVKAGQLVGGLTAIKGVGDKLAANLLRKRANNLPFTPREERLLTSGETPWDFVFEAKERWSHVMQHPELYGINSQLVKLDQINQDSQGVFVFLAKLTEKNLRDHNELQNLQKRGGKRMEGQTLFLNCTVEDDTASIVVNINKFRYERLGKPIVEEAKIGDWYVWKGDMRAGFRKIYIQRWRRMTGNPEFALEKISTELVNSSSPTT